MNIEVLVEPEVRKRREEGREGRERGGPGRKEEEQLKSRKRTKHYYLTKLSQLILYYLRLIILIFNILTGMLLVGPYIMYFLTINTSHRTTAFRRCEPESHRGGKVQDYYKSQRTN